MTDTDTQLPYEVTHNPTADTWGFICREHGIHRTGMIQAHAVNAEAKHIREDHTDHSEAILANLSLDVTSAAMAVVTNPDTLHVWCALTGLHGDEARDLAQHLADRDGHVVAAVVPL